MSTPPTPLYQDTVLLHLGRAATRLNGSDDTPESLTKYADQVFETGRCIAAEILDAPEFAHETLRWSLEHVDQITSLWAYDIEVLGAGVHAAAHVLKSTAFFQGRAIASTAPGRMDRRTKQGRRQMASYARAHTLNNIADKMVALPVRFRLSDADGRMLNEWRDHLDSSARLYGLVS